MSDPIVRLEHDHSHVASLVDALREAITVGDHAEATHTLRLMRDDLFEHFAREEEGLFPYVAGEFPDLVDTVQRVVAAHDRLCGAVSRMAHAIERRADPDTLRTLFERFDLGYAAHALEELELLRVLDVRLTEPQRTTVARLLRDL